MDLTTDFLVAGKATFWVLREIQASCFCFSGSFDFCHLVFLRGFFDVICDFLVNY
jgi:hypothetical protein